MSYISFKSPDSLVSHKSPVSQVEIDEFMDARNLLTKYLNMETIFDQVIEEFWEYRNKIDYWRVRSITETKDHIRGHEIRSSLNRLAVNVLNLGKLYLDKHFYENGNKPESNQCFSFDLTRCVKDYENIKKHREEIYNDNLEYVIGCKLRNHSQHSILPVSTFTVGFKNDRTNNEKRVHFLIKYQYKDLVAVDVPKARISDSIVLDLTEIIEGYVFAISQMRSLNNDLTKEVVNNAKEKMNSIVESKMTKYDAKKDIPELVLANGETIYAGLEWFDVASYLMSKHPFSVDYRLLNYGKGK